MLLSWHDRFLLALTPGQVTLLHAAPGLSPAYSGHQTVCEAEQGWQGALEALAAMLPQYQCRHAQARVVLSNRLVRYQLVPWSEQLDSPQEWQAMVQHCFRQAYGEVAEQWLYRWCDNGYGQPVLACAIDSALLQALQQLFDGMGIRLLSLQPFLMAACNHWRRQLAGQDGAFLLAEPGLVGLLCYRRRHWQELLFEVLPDGEPDALPAVVQRMLLRLPQAAVPADIFTFTAGISVPGWGAQAGMSMLKAPAPFALSGFAEACGYNMAWLGGKHAYR